MEMLEKFERNSVDLLESEMTGNSKLLKGLESNLKPVEGVYQNLHSDMDKNIARWLEMNDVNQVGVWKNNVFDTVKQMLNGREIDGKQTLGLKKISKFSKNPNYYMQNLKQQAGFSAEVISTAKENLLAQKNATGIRTYRADDRLDLFKKNDQYVDKIRVNAKGEVIERIQTKFVGEDGKSCLSKLASKDYDKYFNEGKVDKIEIPKEFYDEIKNKNLIGKERNSLERQLARVKAEGKTDVVQKIQNKLERLDKIDQMMERSTVSKSEAIYATKHPKRYAAKLFAKDIASAGNEVGIKSGLAAAGLTFTVSAVENVSAFIEGKITAKEMTTEIVKDTGAAGALGYGTAFISTSVAQTFSHSSNALIQRIGGSCLPAAIASFAVDSYDSISDFAQGQIDGTELAYDLGESAANVAGSIKGASIGATIGSAAGPVGTVVGGIAGGVVGCVVASEVYATAIEIGAEGAEIVAEQAEKFAKGTVELVKETIPDKVGEVAEAFNDFVKEVRLPFSL